MSVASLLSQVGKPGRYCGNEFNVVKKEWDKAAVRVVLAFPDLYEIGMSHQGLQILYHILNSLDDVLAERVYAPDIDFEEVLRREQEPLFSLESRRPLADFDILGITLPYELCYTNILTILDLAGMPLHAGERNETHPLVIGGGPCAFHPEPVADFFDAILLGDGEEAVVEMVEAVREAKKQGLNRKQLHEKLAAIQGVYVPGFFAPRYDEAGRFQGMHSLRPGYETVSRRILTDLNNTPGINAPLVPAVRIVHDRLGLEIARGCTRGCRFCQAGVIYRPVRERAPEKVLELAEKGIERGGFEELALLSLSTGDYSCLGTMLVKLMDTFARERVSVSMPSMRVGTLTPDIMEEIRRVRKTGFTVAPEAGTDRLRRVINKGITEEDLLATSEAAFSLGWRLIKLYFMFGLPTETGEDLAAIPALAHKVLCTARGGGRQVTVSAATFVPKPHTPFERQPQLSIEQGFQRIDYLKAHLQNRGFKLKWHDPRQSFLEGVFSRGDRRLAPVIETAWRDGARLDAWSGHLDLERWQRAADAHGLVFSEYLRRREAGEPLPWDHLDVGVEADFFEREMAKALKEDYTPDCRVHGCQKCGLCDFKSIRPIVFHGRKVDEIGAGDEHRGVPDDGPEAANMPLMAERFLYQCTYSKSGESRFLSHLELMQIFFRAFRRARLPLRFSQGFNPTPKVSFGPALPLGTESLAEYLVIDLLEPCGDLAELQEKINSQLPSGVHINAIAPAPRHHPAKIRTCYEICLAQAHDPVIVENLLKSAQFIITVQRKGKERDVDVRPLVHELALRRDGTLELVLQSEAGKAGVKPMELAGALFGLSALETQTARVKKMWFEEVQ